MVPHGSTSMCSFASQFQLHVQRFGRAPATCATKASLDVAAGGLFAGAAALHLHTSRSCKDGVSIYLYIYIRYI